LPKNIYLMLESNIKLELLTIYSEVNDISLKSLEKSLVTVNNNQH
jgi:hypothetical protein